MPESFLGEIRIIGFSFDPVGWASCDGRLLLINEYPKLFSQLGTTYGGDGEDTFRLPDLRSRVAVGTDSTSAYPLGKQGGVENVELTHKQLPQHTHGYEMPLRANTDNIASAMTDNPADAVFGITLSAYSIQAGSDLDVLAADALTSERIEAVGSDLSHSNIPPVLALNYIICIEGPLPPS